jgi:hypothetical protein
MGGSLAVSILSKPSKKAFVASLTPEQAALFREISRCRLMIYLASLFIGAVAGYAVMLAAEDGADPHRTACRAAAVAGFATYVSYMLWPKKRWMIHHTTPEQTALWVRYYRDASFQFHLGFVAFLAGYGIFVSEKSRC